MVTTREIRYPADGLTMIGHLARPDGEGPWPGVLLAHDGVGLDDVQRRYADDLAGRGYLAFAMEYHGGTWFTDHEALLARVLPLIAEPDRLRAVGGAGLDVLLAEPGVDPERLGALGLGAGGNVVLELARSGVPFRAVAAVHPGLAAPPTDWAAVRGSVLLATGSEDPLCPPDHVLAAGRALQDAGVDWRAHVHGGAKHAFWHPPVDLAGDHAAHHPQQAERLWADVVALFAEHLPVPSAGADHPELP